MKNMHIYILAAVAPLTILACGGSNGPISTESLDGKASPVQGHAAVGGMHGGGSATISGKITETMDAGGYTYISVQKADGSNAWAAGPQTTVAVGDSVELGAGSMMQGFQSKTLNRTFDSILFVPSITPSAKGAAGAPSEQPAPTAPAAVPTTDAPAHGGSAAKPIAPAGPINVEKAAGGHRIAEIFAGKGALATKQVKVRGKVVKFNSGIMGKNWVHIQDGSGDVSTTNHDLTITTQDTVALGDTVLVTGVLSADVDFGGGYKYSVVIQDGKVAKE